MTRTLVSLLFLALTVGCSSDDGGDTSTQDTAVATDTATADTSDDVAEDSGSTDDVGEDVSDDTGSVDTDATDDTGGDDDTGTAPDTVEDVDEDTGTSEDTGGDPYADRPLGQCLDDSACAGPSASCNPTAPGGLCLGCGSDDDCDGMFVICNDFGSCTRQCDDDSECAPGYTCTATGLCRIASCVDGACPDALFGCSDSNLCQRIDCSGGADVCPTGTTCTDGLCVEDRELAR